MTTRILPLLLLVACGQSGDEPIRAASSPEAQTGAANAGAAELAAAELAPAAAPHLAAMALNAAPLPSPAPLLDVGQPVNWWFAFKFNSNPPFNGCDGGADRACTFGGTVQDYSKFGQQYVYASSTNGALTVGDDCIGDATTDPLGATFGQVYQSANYHFLLWNDQFYDDPTIKGCSDSCSAPWGHSKGMLAWNDQGQGFVLQVSTPSWPASGSSAHPRSSDGNTLGCVEDDDVEVSQHFFSLALSKDDLVIVLKALANASVVTDVNNPQIVSNGGPADVQALVNALGNKSQSTTLTNDVLSSGVRLISKPSKLEVPPWQMISATLGGVPLRVATWWANPEIPTTTDSTPPACWDASLANPGPVEIALTGTWDGNSLGLKGGSGPNYNHAKIGVSKDSNHPYTIFGDMNQQGALSGNCGSSQNGRGGLFYVLEDPALFTSTTALLAGTSSP